MTETPSGDIYRGDSPDADGIVRLSVDDWAEAKVVMSGTSEKIEGDGLTQRFDSLQPGENAVAEVVVDGETVLRIIGGETA
jgi:hypothetical protein